MENPLSDRAKQAHIELGKRMADARILREMTQCELAEVCGVTERTIRNMEAGRNTSLSTWLVAAGHLGYLNDILSVMRQNKPKTIEQADALARRAYTRPQRIRK